MNIKEHRIYRYMDEPVKLLGMTIDEFLFLIGGLIGFISLKTFLIRLVSLFGGIVLVFVLKKYKKVKAGFSVKSYLHWHFGVRLGIPKVWPKSWIRRWRP